MRYRYREPHEMKYSGVEWLGMIPNELENKKINWLFDNISSGTTPNTSNYEYYENGKINWLLTGDLNDSYIVKTSKKISDKALKEISTLKIYPQNTLIIAMYGATIGKLGITKIETTTNQACSCFSNPRNSDIKFIFYWFLGNRKYIIEMGYGGGQPNISQNLLKNIRIPIPDYDIQQKIAKFLDQKTQEFDSVVEKKKRLIERSEEAKKSLISEVVTGKKEVVEIDGKLRVRNREDHEMKDSGVEWLGQIPKEWITSKIKYNTYVKGRIGWQGLKSEEFIDVGPHLVTGTDFIENKINWNTCHRISNERFEEAPTIHLKNGDLLITKDGTIGKLAIVERCPEKAVLNSGVFVTRCTNGEYLTNYMFYILDSKVFSTYIDLTKAGSTIAHLYQETFVKFEYPLPKVKTQQRIIDYLDLKIEFLDNIINKNKEQIVRFKEAKESLISEAVTGKIEILD
jgi:type I restriction enzyme S subunit